MKFPTNISKTHFAIFAIWSQFQSWRTFTMKESRSINTFSASTQSRGPFTFIDIHTDLHQGSDFKTRITVACKTSRNVNASSITTDPFNKTFHFRHTAERHGDAASQTQSITTNCIAHAQFCRSPRRVHFHCFNF